MLDRSRMRKAPECASSVVHEHGAEVEGDGDHPRDQYPTRLDMILSRDDNPVDYRRGLRQHEIDNSWPVSFLCSPNCHRGRMTRPGLARASRNPMASWGS